MIQYRLATLMDNQQLIELTAASGMQGDISLRIDRRPDFFKLLNMRGDTRVFIALDDEKAIGSLCVSKQQVYVGGQVFPVEYIGDFKVCASYRKRGIGMQLCNELADYVISTGSDLAFLNVSKGNMKPLSFFRNRPNMPDFENIGVFKIHQFTGIKRRPLHLKYKIVQTPATDAVIKFLHEHYRRYELGAVITKETLENSGIYIIERQQEIIAAMCITDTMDAKQNVVTKLSWKMNGLLRLLNITRKLFGISRMPLTGEPVRMLYVKYMAVRDNEKFLANMLIHYARNIVFDQSYSFVSIGIHEKDPLDKCFSGMFKITFNSVGMLLSIKGNGLLVEKIKKGIPFEDYSLV